MPRSACEPVAEVVVSVAVIDCVPAVFNAAEDVRSRVSPVNA